MTKKRESIRKEAEELRAQEKDNHVIARAKIEQRQPEYIQ